MNDVALPKKKRDQEIMTALKVVIDPEIFVPITEMGLIYEAIVVGSTAKITMTLTTIGCPLFDVIKKDIETALLKLNNITAVEIELSFDPPWHTGMMSEDLQLELGVA